MKTLQRVALIFLCLAALAGLGGCAPPLDYSPYRPYVEHMPLSILVLPPVNNSANVHASDAFLSTITEPLAEMGYYVYPVAVIDRLFKENGQPMPGDMHAVPLTKIKEVIGPDAVLYITIKEWTTTYLLIDSTTIVALEYKLVDTRTGTVLWQHVGSYSNSSSEAANGTGEAALIVMLVAAQVQAFGNAASNGEFERRTASQANLRLFHDPTQGLLLGAHHPGFAKNQEWIKAEIAKSEAAKQKS